MAAKLSSLVRDGQLKQEVAQSTLDQYVVFLHNQEKNIEENIENTFKISKKEFEGALNMSHLPYLSKIDLLLSRVKDTIDNLG